MKAIIPCAGFGTRMGMKPNQSKELLIDPETGKPMIEWHLELCKTYFLEPFIITRAEKKDLVRYCNKNKISYLCIDPSGEWMSSVQKSKPFWSQNNILLLPDTKFGNTNVMSYIKSDLYLGSYHSLALHSVSDSDKWCVVDNYSLLEKPKEFGNKVKQAFGIIGFNRGTELFEKLEKNKRFKLENCSFQYLDWFRDLTRK